MKYQNLIYFQNGSIGDFLMTIFFLENVYLNNPKLKLVVVVSKNEHFLKQFLEKYPYIQIILINRRSFRGLGGMFKLMKYYFSSNLVLTAPTPGVLSFLVKLIAKTVAVMPNSMLAGFEDEQKINQFIYDKILGYRTNILYPEFLKSVLENLGFKIYKRNPLFEFKKDGVLLRKLDLKTDSYIVVNPMAATQGRSLNEQEILFIIKKIKEISHNLEIVLVGGEKERIFLHSFEGVKIYINLSVKNLSNLIANSALFVGVDTGTTHLASFLNKKSLVIAKNGTPNWLPYYNDKARILYSIKNCPHNLYEGRERLEECRGNKLRCLGNVPLEIIEKTLLEMLENK